MQGEVKVVNIARGFGFISGEDRRDYFFHFNNVLKGTISPHKLVPGDHVAFDILENEDLKRNPQAINVRFTFATLGDAAVDSIQVQAS
jgi:cold shock CspA family protein